MKDREISLKLRASEAVAQRQQIGGSIAVAKLPRLLAAVARPEGQVSVQLQLAPLEAGLGRASGQIEAVLPLVCQRCLSVFEWPLQARVDWLLARDEAEEEHLLAEGDPVLVVDDRLPLHELIEDEVLLQLPIVPLCPVGRCTSEGQTNQGEISHNVELDGSRPNPFAALKGQFPKR